MLGFIMFSPLFFRKLSLKRFQVFDEVALLLFGQAQPPEGIVVLDRLSQGSESSVVIEAALLMRPQSA